MTTSQTYPKLFLLISLLLYGFFWVTPTQTQSDVIPPNDTVDSSPLMQMLAYVPQTPAFPPMTANRMSYANYVLLRDSAKLPMIANGVAYKALTANQQAIWQTAILRLVSGPNGMVNLVDTRIDAMPVLLGIDYFDVDAGLVYGGAPFTGTLFYSANGDFSRGDVGRALHARDYERRTVATGRAWGLGGDGMTNIENMEMGDPFGGDVGLSSRVTVFDETVMMNSFIWDIVFVAADGVAGNLPTYDTDPAYPVMVNFLSGNEGDLLQAEIINGEVGEAQITELSPLPRYELAGIADLQANDLQIHRVVLLYDNAHDALLAAANLPEMLRAFDAGWLDTLGFQIGAVQIEPIAGFYAVTLDLSAPGATPNDVMTGAFQPGLVYGFWVRALDAGTFAPFAVSSEAE